MNSVELFAGAGGLGLGLARAGFEHLAVIEWDANASHTLKTNKANGLPFVRDWPLWTGDVRAFSFDTLSRPVHLLSGGVPCQPFSLGGKHRGHADGRNMFPAFISVVAALAPQVFLIENVKGLLRSSFSPYLDYVCSWLEQPESQPREGENWNEHALRLAASSHSSGLRYRVERRLLNAADYGVPQRRERVFIVGWRSDVDVGWHFPRPTHSREALVFDQAVSGEYWERHGMSRPATDDAQVQLLPQTLPWVTVRDALADLPRLGSREAEELRHVFMPGARPYPGHTGSPLDLPAKTLKAGDHGVPGGENMLVLDDGTYRYMTVREAARLQTFPDEFTFSTSWTENMRQLGNAVPVELAELLGSSIAAHLSEQGAVSVDSAAI